MPDILLATLNARYAHAAFGLRDLLANMGDLRPRTSLLEFEINQRPLDIAETILSNDPLILGLGIYIWNLLPATELVAILKRIRPDLIVVLGGPEVSHESEALEIVRLADHVIRGEGEVAFPDLCRRIFAGDQQPRIIAPQVAELAQIQLPYDLYDEGNLAHRVTYVEASRGCPFECDFCLSALDTGVRTIPPERFLPVMQSLLDRGITALQVRRSHLQREHQSRHGDPPVLPRSPPAGIATPFRDGPRSPARAAPPAHPAVPAGDAASRGRRADVQ